METSTMQNRPVLDHSAAPGTSGEIARGIAADEARDPASALVHYETALAEDSLNYEANWRAAGAAIAVGQQTLDEAARAVRAALYDRAEAYARHAVTARPEGAHGHFILAQAIGLASLAKATAERILRAAEIRGEALRAIELDPSHDGAFHVMGRWHAELARVPSIQRFVARNMPGGRVFDHASWDGATQNLEKAATLAPQSIDHHLALAEVYIDRQQYGKARAQLTEVASLPLRDAMDPEFKKRGVTRLGEIEGKRDGR